MTTKNKNISLTQLCLILIGIFLSMRPILENSIQAQKVENDCIITSILCGVINLGLTMIICYVMYKNPQKSFYDIMSNFFGKTFTKIIMLLLTFVFCFKLLLIDYQMSFLLYDAIYSEIEWLLFAIPVFITLIYIALKGFKSIARCYQLFVPFSVIILIAILLMSLQNAEFENILPLFSHSVSDFSGAINYLLIQSCEFIFLFVCMENVVTSQKRYFSSIFLTMCIIFILVVSFYVLYVAVLGNIAPFVQESLIKMTQFKNYGYGYFKVDLFAIIMWVPIVVLQTAFCIYAIGYCLKKVFNLDEKISTISFVGLLYLTKVIPQINNENVTIFFYEKIGLFVLIFVLLLPILLLIASYKKEKQKWKTI